MNKTDQPYLIKFPKFGSDDIGFISVAENLNLPFVPKRIYWTFQTPDNVSRGEHAHLQLKQVLISMSGNIELTVETINGDCFEFNLDSPEFGVYIPDKSWRKMKYSNNALQVCIASDVYDESDYLRNYNEFEKLKKKFEGN